MGLKGINKKINGNLGSHTGRVFGSTVEMVVEKKHLVAEVLTGEKAAAAGHRAYSDLKPEDKKKLVEAFLSFEYLDKPEPPKTDGRTTTQHYEFLNNEAKNPAFKITKDYGSDPNAQG